MSLYKNRLVQITIPGTINSAKDDVFIQTFKKELAKCGITGVFVDTIINWGCLNQDWLEFGCDVESSYGWCQLSIPDLPEKLNKEFQERLHAGLILMQVDDHA